MIGLDGGSGLEVGEAVARTSIGDAVVMDLIGDAVESVLTMSRCKGSSMAPAGLARERVCWS